MKKKIKKNLNQSLKTILKNVELNLRIFIFLFEKVSWDYKKIYLWFMFLNYFVDILSNKLFFILNS